MVIYVVILIGNIVILTVVSADCSFHTPLDFFLGYFSFLDIGYNTTIEPVILKTLLSAHVPISFSGCVCQFYYFAALVVTECFFLVVMFYDCYMAICNPLHNSSMMDYWDCLQLAIVSWVAGFLAPILLLVLIFQLTVCASNEINHFFCDWKPIMKLECTDTQVAEITFFICTSLFNINPFLLTEFLYLLEFIISTFFEVFFYHRETEGLLQLFLLSDSGQSVLWDTEHCLWLPIRTSVWRLIKVSFSLVYSTYPCPKPYHLYPKEQVCKGSSEKIGATRNVYIIK